MDNGEHYVSVHGIIHEVRPQSILFAAGDNSPRPEWIPRSLIHGADERTLDGRFAGEEMTLRVFTWKARELGWLPAAKDSNTRDLFGGKPFVPFNPAGDDAG